MIHKTIVLLILLAALSPAFAETQPYSIGEIVYKIEGQTTSGALERYMDLHSGDQFSSYIEMEQTIAEEVQNLLNLRLFQEGSYELETEIGNEFTLTIYLKDGWKIYPIPYPKYDSNTGFRLGMEFYYFNVGGSLLNFFIEGAVDLKLENGRMKTGDWKINPSVNNIKIGSFIFSAEILQSFTNNRTIENYVLQRDYDVYRTDLIISSKINLPESENIFYTVSPEFRFAYGFEDHLGTAQYYPFQFYWKHSFSYEAIDWLDFKRSGFSGEAGHSLGFSPYDDDVKISTSIDLEILYFHTWRKINPSIRFYAIKSWNEEIEDLGENMRGVLDDYMFGEQALFFNFSLEFPIVDVKDKFELHLQPFIDMGTVFKSDFRFSGGTDLIVFADRFSSLQFRFSFGADLNSLFSSDPDTYELEISSSLAY